MEFFKDNVKFIEKVPLDALKRNRFGAQKMKVPPQRGRFFEMINYTLETNDPLLIGKFLVPEVAEELKLSVTDILPLEPMLSKLDELHQYQVIIFNHIKNNNSFILTEEQLDEAYQFYISTRKDKEK